MGEFDAVERADNWLGKVRDWFQYTADRAGGPEAWNSDPAQRVTRERSVRLLVRAVNRRERAIGDLAGRGVPAVTTRARLNTVRGRDRVRVRS